MTHSFAYRSYLLAAYAGGARRNDLWPDLKDDFGERGRAKREQRAECLQQANSVYFDEPDAANQLALCLLSGVLLAKTRSLAQATLVLVIDPSYGPRAGLSVIVAHGLCLPAVMRTRGGGGVPAPV